MVYPILLLSVSRSQYVHLLYDDVDCAAATVMRQSTETKTLRNDTLAGERRVTVQLNTENAVTQLALCGRGFEQVHLLAAGDTQGDRIDGLKMRWVLEHFDLDFLTIIVNVIDLGKVTDDIACRSGCCLWVEFWRTTDLGEERLGVVGEQRWVTEEIQTATVGKRHDNGG